MDSGCHKLSENIWFVWSKMSNSGDIEGCHARGQRTNNEQRNVKIELEFWKQNSQKVEYQKVEYQRLNIKIRHFATKALTKCPS